MDPSPIQRIPLREIRARGDRRATVARRRARQSVLGGLMGLVPV